MRIIKKQILSVMAFALCSGILSAQKKNLQSEKGDVNRPNIIYIICDDLGYGDVHVLAPKTSKKLTPHADKLAGEGMIFTDAHSGSSVCTPTRYGIMTGRYSWRSKLQSGVVQGYDDNLIVDNRPTVASHLKEQGYHTAILGKWHLNFNYLNPNTGETLSKPKKKKGVNAPVGTVIPDGPITRGFDYFYGIHHARSMKEIIENDQVIKHENEINFLPSITKKSVEYIAERAKDKNTPFFLYLPLGSPHTPIVPSPKWQGKSDLGKYGDFVMETDNVVGEVSKALEKHGLTENTLIIFTSDNGASKAANIPELAKKGHHVSAHMRGSKSDLWDGGHRIPFIVRWPAMVKSGSISKELICLTDLFATLSEITKTSLPKNGAEDSFSFLPALKEKPINSERKGVIHHSISGHFAYRQGKWKLLLAKGSGGWTTPREKDVLENTPIAQLYNIEIDPGETNNLYESEPEIVQQLLEDLKSDIYSGATRNGTVIKNDVDKIILWKSMR